MAINAGIFGDKTSFDHRYIPDHAKLETSVQLWKQLGLKIVLTSGTFDLFHIGHAQYLEKAKELGDVLIVGVDSDDRVKKRKGPDRPVVPDSERVLILSHVRHVDVVTIKNVNDPSNHLIKLIKPDVLVVSESTKHADNEVDEKSQYCGEIIVLEPQATTSTSAKLRRIQIGKEGWHTGNMIAVCHIPVIHKGYLNFIRSCEERGVTTLFLVDLAFLQPEEEFDYLVRKNSLHALSSEEIKKALEQYTSIPVIVLTTETLAELTQGEDAVLMPKEDISTFISERYLTDRSIEYVDVFLRWNRENLGETKEPDVRAGDLPEFVTTVFHQVLAEATKSADWWRNVGAALVKNGEVIALAHNDHMPFEQLPNVFSDARALFKKGININYATSAHAEVGVIAEAARKGISPEGAELFLTDFPCPYCARLVAKAGVKKIYFLKGYAVLEGDEFLKGEGVELIQVGL